MRPTRRRGFRASRENGTAALGFPLGEARRPRAQKQATTMSASSCSGLTRASKADVQPDHHRRHILGLFVCLNQRFSAQNSRCKSVDFCMFCATEKAEPIPCTPAKNSLHSRKIFLLASDAILCFPTRSFARVGLGRLSRVASPAPRNAVAARVCCAFRRRCLSQRSARANHPPSWRVKILGRSRPSYYIARDQERPPMIVSAPPPPVRPAPLARRPRAAHATRLRPPAGGCELSGHRGGGGPIARTAQANRARSDRARKGTARSQADAVCAARSRRCVWSRAASRMAT